MSELIDVNLLDYLCLSGWAMIPYPSGSQTAGWDPLLGHGPIFGGSQDWEAGSWEEKPKENERNWNRAAHACLLMRRQLASVHFEGQAMGESNTTRLVSRNADPQQILKTEVPSPFQADQENVLSPMETETEPHMCLLVSGQLSLEFYQSRTQGK